MAQGSDYIKLRKNGLKFEGCWPNYIKDMSCNTLIVCLFRVVINYCHTLYETSKCI